MTDWERLDARMLLIGPTRVVRQFAIPFIIALVGIRTSDGGFGTWLLPFLVLGALVLGALPWLTTYFRRTDTQLQVRRGVLRRTVVTAPLDRVRSVDLESSLLHRLLGLTTVTIGTGVDDTRIELDSLSTTRADRLRVELLQRAPSPQAPDHCRRPPARSPARRGPRRRPRIGSATGALRSWPGSTGPGCGSPIAGQVEEELGAFRSSVLAASQVNSRRKSRVSMRFSTSGSRWPPRQRSSSARASWCSESSSSSTTFCRPWTLPTRAEVSVVDLLADERDVEVLDLAEETAEAPVQAGARVRSAPRRCSRAIAMYSRVPFSIRICSLSRRSVAVAASARASGTAYSGAADRRRDPEASGAESAAREGQRATRRRWPSTPLNTRLARGQRHRQADRQQLHAAAYMPGTSKFRSAMNQATKTARRRRS